MLHSKVIHRDMKPANVLRDGAVLKIGDYGLAKFVDQATRTPSFKNGGTPMYMAPEIGCVNLPASRRISTPLGAMLFEASTGRTPYTSADWLKPKMNISFPQFPGQNRSIQMCLTISME